MRMSSEKAVWLLLYFHVLYDTVHVRRPNCDYDMHTSTRSIASRTFDSDLLQYRNRDSEYMHIFHRVLFGPSPLPLWGFVVSSQCEVFGANRCS
jgi:hypothetical protein